MNETPNNGETTGKRRRREADEEEEDRISQLPDSLLIDILCFLPIKTVVVTSTLSNRWRYLWTQITHLDLTLPLPENTGKIVSEGRYHKFIKNVDTIFRQLASPKIHTFNLCVHGYVPNHCRCKKCVTCYKSWIEQVCSRKVEVLSLTNLYIERSPFFRLPACLFASQSLVKFELIGFNHNIEFDVPEKIHLPNLTDLRLKILVTCQKTQVMLLTTLFKSCPALESLDLGFLFIDDLHSIDILAPNLKSLCLHIYESLPDKKVEFVIDTPNLEHIELTGSVFLRFVEIPSALQIANIAISYSNLPKTDYHDSYMPGLVRGISCARHLDLGRYSLNLFSLISSVHRLPLFRNLESIHLHPSLYLPKETNWGAPVLGCLLGKVKRVDISGRNTSENRIKLVEYILKNAPALKELAVTSGLKDGPGASDKSDNEKHIKQLREEREFSKELSELLSRYSNCQIEFFGDTFRACSA